MDTEEKLRRFKELKLLKAKQKMANRKEVAKEQRQRAAEAGPSSAPKKESKTAANDRIANMKYTIDEIERWEAKKQRKQSGPQSFEQLAELSYARASKTTVADHEAYERHKSQGLDGMDYKGQIPKSKIQQVVGDYKDLHTRKTQKYTRHKTADSTSSFINEKNQAFNKKLDQHYDQYTSDLKESFKRGTAL